MKGSTNNIVLQDGLFIASERENNIKPLISRQCHITFILIKFSAFAHHQAILHQTLSTKPCKAKVEISPAKEPQTPTQATNQTRPPQAQNQKSTMKGDTTILRPTFDAMSSTLFAGPPLANVTHVKASFERSAMAMFAVAQRYWIELASILVLCLLLCVGFFGTSISRRKQPSNSEHPADIQGRLLEDSAGHLSGCAESKHHLVTGIGDQSPHVQEIGIFTREWEGFPLPRDTLLAMYENISVSQTGTTEFSEKDMAGPWQPRRSGRMRKPTSRFEESWYNERLQALGLALGVDTTVRLEK